MKEYSAILVGNGTMGKRHRARFESLGVRFTQVLDIGASASLKSLNFTRERPDFAVIATPASTHYEYVRFFLAQGTPVLVEKPLATSAEEVRELVALSHKKGALLFVAQSECYNPVFLRFRHRLLADLESAAKRAAAPGLNAHLVFHREHGFTSRCRDVDVSLDLLVHDTSLILNLFGSDCVSVANILRDPMGDKVSMSLKVMSGKFAGVSIDLYEDRNSVHDERTITVYFGRNSLPASGKSEYSVSLVHYSSAGEVVHIPDSLDNEHRLFLKFLSGMCGEWASRALKNAADAVELATYKK